MADGRIITENRETRERYYTGDEEEDESLLALSLSHWGSNSSAPESSSAQSVRIKSSTAPVNQVVLLGSNSCSTSSQRSLLPLFPGSTSAPPLPNDNHDISFPENPNPNPEPEPDPNPNGIPILPPRVWRLPVRSRARGSPPLKPGKSETIKVHYRWATDRRAQIHNLDYLRAMGITVITGDVECKVCDKQFTIDYNLEEKFREVTMYIAKNIYSMNERAPPVWMNPNLPACRYCKKNVGVKPVQKQKQEINWLFLLLGQMLGCCKLSDLKYFCKFTLNHRTGAKDRVLYLTYLELCNQLCSTGPSN